MALVGGSSPPRPGEISLAHGGVLFLDVLPEFPRAALEALRAPLEASRITISRAARQGCANALLEPAQIDQHCTIDNTAACFIQHAAARLGWSGRAMHRVLKVARTIADLAAAESIAVAHLAEAMQYRRALRET